jgi:TonB family protein
MHMQKIWLSAALFALVAGAPMYASPACARPVEAAPPLDSQTHDKKKTPSKDVDFGPYMANLQHRIKRAWFPPKGSGSERAVAQFKVSKEGEVSDLHIYKSSHVKIFDDAALEAVKDAHFEPLPAGASDSVDVQFTFDYNVWKNNKKLPPDDATADSGDVSGDETVRPRSKHKRERSSKNADELSNKEVDEFWSNLVRTTTPVCTTTLSVIQGLLAGGIFLWLGLEWLHERKQ